jgi:hypothetical protein
MTESTCSVFCPSSTAAGEPGHPMSASELQPETTPPARPADPVEKAPLETLLLRSGLITLRQISEAHRIMEESGKEVAEVIAENGWVDAETIATLTAESEPQAATGPPALYVVFANLDDGARLEVSEHPDAETARISAAGAVGLVESDGNALLELGNRRFPAHAITSIEIIEII